MRAVLAVVAAVVLFAGCDRPPAPPGSVPVDAVWVDVTNGERVVPLARDERLDRVAYGHAVNMADSLGLVHQDLDPILATGQWWIAGENVGTGSTVEQIHAGFLASPSHRANIVRREFDRVGVGVVWVGSRMWVSVVFAA